MPSLHSGSRGRSAALRPVGPSTVDRACRPAIGRQCGAAVGHDAMGRSLRQSQHLDRRTTRCPGVARLRSTQPGRAERDAPAGRRPASSLPVARIESTSCWPQPLAELSVARRSGRQEDPAQAVAPVLAAAGDRPAAAAQRRARAHRAHRPMRAAYITPARLLRRRRHDQDGRTRRVVGAAVGDVDRRRLRDARARCRSESSRLTVTL